MHSKNILAIGAHPDDIEFGCIGTLKKHITQGDKVICLVMSATSVKDSYTNKITRDKNISIKETKNSIENTLGAKLIIAPFIDTQIPFNSESVSFIEKILRKYSIDIIYTHWAGDTHQDHINTLESSLAASRLIPNVYCYEQVPLPRVCNIYPVANHYVDITPYMDIKISCSECHHSQVEKYNNMGINIIDNLTTLAKYRGMQCNCKYAEAFVVLKSLS